MAVTNAVSWRSEGVRHKKNEVFLDVVESVNLLVASTGQVVASEVQGTLKMRTFLSGMPECKLGLNDKVLFEAQGRGGRQKAVEMEDVRFHQCVRLVSRNAVLGLRPASWLPEGGLDAGEGGYAAGGGRGARDEEETLWFALPPLSQVVAAVLAEVLELGQGPRPAAAMFRTSW